MDIVDSLFDFVNGQLQINDRSVTFQILHGIPAEDRTAAGRNHTAVKAARGDHLVFRFKKTVGALFFDDLAKALTLFLLNHKVGVHKRA